MKIGNWILSSPSVGTLSIENCDGIHQRVIIMEDLPGFIAEADNQADKTVRAEKTLGSFGISFYTDLLVDSSRLDFVTGWGARGGGRRVRFGFVSKKDQLHELAKEIWNNYMKEARSKPRSALVELQKASSTVKEICSTKVAGLPQVVLLRLEEALKCMHLSVVSDRLLSTFELSISGIVDALLSLFKSVQECAEGEILAIFMKVFADQRSFCALVRKMVSVLDATEKFPQYLYDLPGGSSFGLQLLGRRIRLRLEQLNPNTLFQMRLLNRTGRTMKAEPLVTVKQLKSYIQQMVVKQWYDHPRETFSFVEQIKCAKERGVKISFLYTSDFDENGIIYWLGTNGGTVAEWTNPASVSVVCVTCSDGERLPYGRHEDILSRDVNALNCHTSDDKNAHFTVDLGVYVYPDTYTLRHARGYGRSALRTWLLQGSVDGNTWDVLMVHEGDTSLSHPGSTATWPLSCNEGKGISHYIVLMGLSLGSPYRYIRIAQNGKNASNQNHYLSLSGFEIYGDIVDVVVGASNDSFVLVFFQTVQSKSRSY
ncbi:unnamed protein product [Gongylonema pulchrum]|uniref:E3 ubiquitin-protein ligase n=1 Tax=Gongylonema pulchrum TaxID=637853 RepID=A0A183DXH3_9BILA|nr:unnamed protein product [Gongylonema pulchrum]